MDNIELKKIIEKLVALPRETEWVEFKENFHALEEIGERISALSNSARLLDKPFGYLIYGVTDESHEMVGTTFYAKEKKKGNEELEMWLVNRLSPRIDLEVYDVKMEKDIHLAVYRIPATNNRPVTFLNRAYIRIGTMTKPLMGYPEKEAKLWKMSNNKPLSRRIAKSGLTATDVVSLLSVQTYFDLMNIPMPQSSEGVIERFIQERFVISGEVGFDITELGALVLAKNLGSFDSLIRKQLRIIVYKGKNKIETVREYQGYKGYAVGFAEYLDWINGQLPANEEIGRALRKNVRMYPEIAIRELLANTLIHQDFDERGFPMVEIYSDRIEISNPGLPLISVERFIDEYVSRNDMLADILRRMGICEEKGSGMDKVIFYNELYQLPPVDIQTKENRTVTKLYTYRPLKSLNKPEKIRACYQHACLKYVSNEKMTNQTLRARFRIDDHNYSIASRIIKDAIDAKLLKEDENGSKSRRFTSYLPFWA